MDLDTVIDELYGLPLGEFTATRNARAKQARADGDRELAAEIGRLAKPTTSAWLVNRLTRELGDELEPLIELGRDLREATSNVSGDELRTLTRQRHEVVHALVQQARRLGAAHDTTVSQAVATEVQHTLDASLADPEVAEAVLAGRLTHAVEYAGFGEPADVSWAGGARRSARTARASGPGGDASPGRSGTVTDLEARRRESAQRAVSEARERLEAARREEADASAEHERTSADAQRADEEVDRLRGELEAAEERAGAAGEAERSARQRLSRAEREVEAAEQEQEAAAAQLDELGR